MKYHIQGGCLRNYISPRLTRAEFNNTLSSQRCRTCERIAYGEVAARAAAVSRGEMIEARQGETMRLTRNGPEVVSDRFDFAGTREACSAELIRRGFKCEHGVGWYKPGWLAMINYRHPENHVAEVANWDSANFVASGWPSSAAPKNWL